jgi:serine/threonine protein kinase
MTPERWQQIRTLFDSALEQRHSAREEFVRAACGDDLGLLEEVSRLLQAEYSSGPLDHPEFAQTAATSRLPPVFQAGQIVAKRYSVLRYISCGGMGEVYEAKDLDLELTETIALKTLLPAVADSESMIAHFKREIALSRTIAHPNVCKVYDLDRHDERGRSTLFLTMEFLAGETLEARLKHSGAMREAEMLPLLMQMAAGLDASHKSGVIHRDLKPSNVMLVPKGDSIRVVVTDFGLARRFVGQEDPTATITNAVVGTLDYMAPELMKGSPATFASDIYAFGIVVYRMATGSLPFAADTPMAGAFMRSSYPVPSPRTLAPELDKTWEDAILRSVDSDPSKRFASAGAFLGALMEANNPPRNFASTFLKLPIVQSRRLMLMGLGSLAVAVSLIIWHELPEEGRRLSPEVQALYEKGVADDAAGAWFAATKALGEAVRLAPGALQARARLAEAWVGLEMSEKAAEEMLLVRRLDSSRLSRTDRLQIEAIDLSITREFKAAAAKYEQLAGAGVNVSVDLGRAYENADKPDEAIRSYLRAAEGPEHNPAAWLRLGVLYARQSNAVKSNEAFAEADRLYQLTSNLEGLTEVLLQHGIAENTRGHLQVASAFLRKAFDTARLAGNVQEEINATLRLSTNAYLAGNTADADQYARDALSMARSHHLDAMAIRGLINLGNAYRRKQDVARSEQYYRDGLDLARQTRSTHLTALSLISLAGLHDEIRQPETAVREAQEALTFYQTNRFAKESIQCLTIIARAKRDEGDYHGALLSFRGLLQMAERGQDRAQLALTHEGIGTILFRQERFPEALEEYRKSLELAPDEEHVGYANLECANTLWRIGEYKEAEAMFARADVSAEKFLPLRLQLMYSRAAMSLSQNQFQKAAKLAREALAEELVRTKDLQTELDLVLGRALMGLGNTKEGGEKCKESLAAIEARHDIVQVFPAELAVLETRIRQGERKTALELLEQMEPGLATHPDSGWRALAWASSVDSQYVDRAREALKKLAQIWGNQVYTDYLSRPDVANLARPLLPLGSEIR